MLHFDERPIYNYYVDLYPVSVFIKVNLTDEKNINFFAHKFFLIIS